MTIQDIMNQLRNMKADFVNGNINSEELVEEIKDFSTNALVSTSGGIIAL